MPATIPTDSTAVPSLRLAAPGDEPFLRQLYRASRSAEFASLGWTEPQVAALCDAQFDAQATGYRSAFPQAEHFVVCVDAVPVGRVITARDAPGVLIVDIALAPSVRGRGWGTQVIRALQDRARADAMPLRVDVERSSRAAAWYRKLGFVECGERGLHLAMAWTPP